MKLPNDFIEEIAAEILRRGYSSSRTIIREKITEAMNEMNEACAKNGDTLEEMLELIKAFHKARPCER